MCKVWQRLYARLRSDTVLGGVMENVVYAVLFLVGVVSLVWVEIDNRKYNGNK